MNTIYMIRPEMQIENSMDPEEDFYLVVRAYLYNSQKEFQKALNDCNAVIQKENNNAETYYQRGIAYRGLKKLKEAKDDFLMSIRLDPDMEEALEALDEINLIFK